VKTLIVIGAASLISLALAAAVVIDASWCEG